MGPGGGSLAMRSQLYHAKLFLDSNVEPAKIQEDRNRENLSVRRLTATAVLGDLRYLLQNGAGVPHDSQNWFGV